MKEDRETKWDIWEEQNGGKRRRVAKNLSSETALILSANMNDRSSPWNWFAVEIAKPSFFERLLIRIKLK